LTHMDVVGRAGVIRGVGGSGEGVRGRF